MSDVLLTTYNNPYDPFVDWDSWYRFDVNNKTDCCGYLSRMVDSIIEANANSKFKNTNDSFIDDETNDAIIDEAMNKIIKLNPLTYLKVYPGDRRYSLPMEDFKKTIPKIDTD